MGADLAVILHIRSRQSFDTLGIGRQLSYNNQPCAPNTILYKTTPMEYTAAGDPSYFAESSYISGDI
jgi:hypothetical protein